MRPPSSACAPPSTTSSRGRERGRRQARRGARQAVLHVDLRQVVVGARLEAQHDRARAVGLGRGFHVGQARRGKRLGAVQGLVGNQAHRDAAGVPAAGNQAAKAAVQGGLGVGVEPLRVIGAGELQDIGLAQTVSLEG